jgi:hypothetical protein
MKFQLKNIAIALVATLALVSCSNDDETVNNISGNGNLKVEFDQIYNDADFAANTPYTNSNGEIVTINKAKYIVSNIVLTNENGSTYTIPKNESYYIIDEFTPASTLIELTNIPAGNYTKISYGIGVDQDQFNLGATGQGNFLTQAQDAGMMWSWSAGYKFLAFEGSFTSSSVTTASNFRVHTGQTGTDYNYTTITLDLPEMALVRTTITPQIHIFSDLSKILDGTNKLALSEAAGGDIMGGSKLTLVTANLSNMFKVNHVHND